MSHLPGKDRAPEIRPDGRSNYGRGEEMKHVFTPAPDSTFLLHEQDAYLPPAPAFIMHERGRCSNRRHWVSVVGAR